MDKNELSPDIISEDLNDLVKDIMALKQQMVKSMDIKISVAHIWDNENSILLPKYTHLSIHEFEKMLEDMAEADEFSRNNEFYHKAHEMKNAAAMHQAKIEMKLSQYADKWLSIVDKMQFITRVVANLSKSPKNARG